MTTASSGFYNGCDAMTIADYFQFSIYLPKSNKTYPFGVHCCLNLGFQGWAAGVSGDAAQPGP